MAILYLLFTSAVTDAAKKRQNKTHSASSSPEQGKYRRQRSANPKKSKLWDVSQFEVVPVKAKLFRVPSLPLPEASVAVITPALVPSAIPSLK